MILQLEKGLKIAKWADVVTAYPFPGAKTFESLRKEVFYYFFNIGNER